MSEKYKRHNYILKQNLCVNFQVKTPCGYGETMHQRFGKKKQCFSPKNTSNMYDMNKT